MSRGGGGRGRSGYTNNHHLEGRNDGHTNNEKDHGVSLASPKWARLGNNQEHGGHPWLHLAAHEAQQQIASGNTNGSLAGKEADVLSQAKGITDNHTTKLVLHQNGQDKPVTATEIEQCTPSIPASHPKQT
ncbi:hypothetical protein F0562_007354 [Nyssa sinensis]|uniref:Uncharacterized protein n=1 Tax=Nyssa sinensis TaxID=561372 RepID=A0A5J5A5A6_9ASTE|nr:hypothetical protein F0562_007354 [Nyssa sinensis]